MLLSLVLVCRTTITAHVSCNFVQPRSTLAGRPAVSSRLCLFPITIVFAPGTPFPSYSPLEELSETTMTIKSRLTPPTTETPSPTGPPGSTPTPRPAASAPRCCGSAVDLLPGLVLGLGRVVYQQGVERQRVGQDVVADGAAADVHGVEDDGILALGRHLDVAEGRVHLRGDGGDGAVHDGAVFELDCYRLVGAFHEESVKQLSVSAAGCVRDGACSPGEGAQPGGVIEQGEVVYRLSQLT